MIKFDSLDRMDLVINKRNYLKCYAIFKKRYPLSFTIVELKKPKSYDTVWHYRKNPIRQDESI